MDVYKEQLVKYHPDSVDKMKKASVIVIAVSLMFIALYVFFLIIPYPPMALVAIVLLGYGAYCFLRTLNYEYEYIFTNGELDIDKIVAKSKRKRLCTVKISTFTRICEYAEGVEPESDVASSIIVTDGTDGKIYLAEFNHPSLGQCALYFSPDEEMLECVKKYLPRALKDSI